MDPFNEVREDAYSTISIIEALLIKSGPISQDLKLDYNNNIQELYEIYRDLEQAVKISEENPKKFNLTAEDIGQRKDVLGILNSKIEELKSRWDAKIRSTHREVTSMSNRISQDDSDNPFADNYAESMSQFEQQQVLQEQDLQLDTIHETMRNLNQQAQLMGGELEDQAFMLDNLDNELENADHKIQRGLKAISFVISKNREKASDWCIGILVVALCVLLIIVIAI